jgi:UDP-N-acetyl-D-galactosamine dehydrogenase
MNEQQRHLSVIGLGYVGLPVAVAFAQRYAVIAFDIEPERVQQLQQGEDATQEICSKELQSGQINFTHQVADLTQANFHIVAVPTPIDEAHKPDLVQLLAASIQLGKLLKKGDIVVYESTVYPGATEEECIPLLEQHSGLKAGKDFFVGYSPERINPGDSEHTFISNHKVVAAQDSKTCDIIAAVYGAVVKGGIYKADNIKVAEAAKVIENTQRDLNIALMNELAKICHKLNIDTTAVINAASTKWNFMPYKPGLVGGHCISVDPYYLTYKAKQLGYRPEVILAGRRLNDNMGSFIAEQTIKQLIKRDCVIANAKVAVLGLCFKENCADLRNSRVIDVIREIEDYGLEVVVHDPLVDKAQSKTLYGLECVDFASIQNVDAFILCVAHQYYCELDITHYANKLTSTKLMIDVKAVLDQQAFAQQNIQVWRL